VLPAVNAVAMDLLLARFAATPPPGVHAALVLDGAGWHDARADTPALVLLGNTPILSYRCL
jgi:hypothetical protein